MGTEFEDAVRASAERLGRTVELRDMELRSFGRDALEINWTQLKKLMPSLVTTYVDIIEIAETEFTCDCEWIIHPDDIDKPVGTRRKRRGMESPACAVHTKTGLILGFFKWVMTGAIKD